MTVASPPRIIAETPAVARKKPGNLRATILAVVAWQVVALLFVEGILYWSGLGEEDIYKMDKSVGFRHFPNKRVTWRSEGYSVSYFDADGMREPGLKIEKPAGVYRIALLGDSMVEGLQVPIEQTFGKLVEKRLNGESNRSVEILNFANSGYSTVQEYLLLKEKVFKYHPDLVVLGYMNRDMFENWTGPDETITNVRPVALQLPGQPLVIDNSNVKKWMRSPRGRFLTSISWLRQNSRIWGLVSSTTMQLSNTDPFYKGLTALLTNPVTTIQDWAKQAQQFKLSQTTMQQLVSPSFSIKFFEGSRAQRKITRDALVQSSIMRAPSSAPKVELVTAPQLHPHAQANGSVSAEQTNVSQNKVAANSQFGTNDALARNSKIGTNARAGNRASAIAPSASATDTSQAKNGNANYVSFISTTMQALLEAMQYECTEHGSKFALVFLPSRAQLCPSVGMQTDFFNLTYKDEERIVSNACNQLHIPYFDGEESAEHELASDKRADLFYLMHFNAKGHEFFANQVFPFFEEQVKSGSK